MKFLNRDRPTSQSRHILLALLGVATLLLLWSVTSYSGLIRPLFLPTPTDVFLAGATLFCEHNFLDDILISVYRVFLGFGLSVAFALPVGTYLGLAKKGGSFFDPIISFTRYIPPSAFLPLFILWFGIGELQKVLLIFAGVAPYLTLLIVDAISDVETKYLEVAYTLGLQGSSVIFRVILPRALPSIWNAMRLMIGAAWTFVVLAEIVASTAGLGHVIIAAQRFLQTANVMAAIFVIGMIGLLTDILLKRAYRKLFPWAERITYA